MMDSLEVPEDLARNTARVIDTGLEHTGEVLINLAAQRSGFTSLENVDVLDVGCSTRFTQTIINRKIEIGSYYGIEVRKPVVDYLNERVVPNDDRFEYAHWNVKNELYNPDGEDMSLETPLPCRGTYDLIWLFSVFTHLEPADALIMLKLLRKCVRAEGMLFFTAFVDEELTGEDESTGFLDKDPGQPVMFAHYSRELLERLISESNWRVEKLYDRDLTQFIQHHHVCSPA